MTLETKIGKKKAVIVVTPNTPTREKDRKTFPSGIYPGKERDVVVVAFRGFSNQMRDIVLDKTKRLRGSVSPEDVEMVYVYMERRTSEDGGPQVAKDLVRDGYNVTLVSCLCENGYIGKDKWGNPCIAYTNYKREAADKLGVPLISSGCGGQYTLAEIIEKALD